MPLPKSLASIPFQGSGIGYRHEISEAIWEHAEDIDCLEIITDRYIEHDHLAEELERLCDSFAVIPHGIGLSIGSPRVCRGYLREVKRISDIAGAAYYSEHLCMTRAPGIDLGHLAPIWFTNDVLERTIANVDEVQDFLGKPLILENTTYPFEIPHAEMSQAEFFGRLVEATGCGILLDITNAYINGLNHGCDPEQFLDDLPLDHVVQLHMSGGYWAADGEYIDGHSQVPEQGIWALLRQFASRADVQGSILEHDSNFPDDFSLLLDTVLKTREVFGWPGRRQTLPPQEARVAS